MRSATATSSSVARNTVAHRHRLQRLFGHVPQHGRGVEPDLGALASARAARCARLAVVAEHVVQRRLRGRCS